VECIDKAWSSGFMQRSKHRKMDFSLTKASIIDASILTLMVIQVTLRRVFYKTNYSSKSVLALDRQATNTFLIQTFCAIFTLPSSCNAIDNEGSATNDVAQAFHCKKHHLKATKANVATLLHMGGSVTPCSIAYTAVLVSRAAIPCEFYLMTRDCLASLQFDRRITMGRRILWH